MPVKARLRLNSRYLEWGAGVALHLLAQTEQDAAEGYLFGRWSVRVGMTEKFRKGDEDVVRLDFLVSGPIDGLRAGGHIKLFGGTKCIAEGSILNDEILIES